MKAAKQTTEFTEHNGAHIRDAVPELQMLFHFCVLFLRLRLGRVSIIVTSVKRSRGVHSLRRGIDFTVSSNEEMRKNTQLIRTLLMLKNLVNLLFPYTKGDGTPAHTMVYRMRSGNGTDAEHILHVHLQRPDAGWFTQPGD